MEAGQSELQEWLNVMVVQATADGVLPDKL